MITYSQNSDYKINETQLSKVIKLNMKNSSETGRHTSSDQNKIWPPGAGRWFCEIKDGGRQTVELIMVSQQHSAFGEISGIWGGLKSPNVNKFFELWVWRFFAVSKLGLRGPRSHAGCVNITVWLWTWLRSPRTIASRARARLLRYEAQSLVVIRMALTTSCIYCHAVCTRQRLYLPVNVTCYYALNND